MDFLSTVSIATDTTVEEYLNTHIPSSLDNFTVIILNLDI